MDRGRGFGGSGRKGLYERGEGPAGVGEVGGKEKAGGRRTRWGGGGGGVVGVFCVFWGVLGGVCWFECFGVFLWFCGGGGGGGFGGGWGGVVVCWGVFVWVGFCVWWGGGGEWGGCGGMGVGGEEVLFFLWCWWPEGVVSIEKGFFCCLLGILGNQGRWGCTTAS